MSQASGPPKPEPPEPGPPEPQSPPSLRWARPGDAETIAAYHHRCWVKAFAPLVSPEVMAQVEPLVERWRDWLREGSGFRTVVTVDPTDTPIGHTTVNGGQLVHLFVAPEHQRCGLGRALLEVGERLIRQAGHTRAELNTRVGNEPAIALYRSCGWVVTDDTVVMPLPDGSTYREHVVVKDLGNAGHVVANREDWDAAAPDWLERGRRSWQGEPHWGEMQVPEADVAALPALAGRDVIELGCGTGYVSAWCLRAGARSAVGLDNSSGQLRSAQQLQREFGLRFPLVWADAERAPFANNSFDVAVSEYGAALWCDPYRWIPEAARLLRPGGSLMFLSMSTMLAMCAPDFEAEGTSTQLLRPLRDLHRIVFPDTDGVEFGLSHGRWIDLLTANGFVIDRLIELYAPDDGPDRYSYYDASWARRWPAEEIWTATYLG